MTDIEIVNKILKPFQTKEYVISYSLNKKDIERPDKHIDGFFQTVIRKKERIIYLISFNFDLKTISILDIDKGIYNKYAWKDKGDDITFYTPKGFETMARYNKSLRESS